MAQFDVFALSAMPIEYVVSIQTDLLADAATTMVIPLQRDATYRGLKMTRLHPVLEIDGDDFVLLTTMMTPVPSRKLRSPVSSLAEQRAKIITAVDFLMQGF